MEPRAASWRPRVILAACCVLAVVAGGFVLRRSAFDLPVDEALNRLHQGVLGEVGTLVYHVVGPTGAIIGTVVLTALILLISRDLRIASTFAVTIAVTWVPSALVKIVIGRPRPDRALLPHPFAAQTDASYPSGHTVFAVALVVTAVIVTSSVVLRRLWVVLGVIGVAGLAFLLLTDGVHFPTDIAASAVWSIGVAPLVAWLWMRVVIPRIPFLRPGRRAAH